MATIFNYEIFIDNRSDSVYVGFFDKILYELFEYNYSNTDVIKFNMTLDNFYKIMIKSLDALIAKDKKTATIKINQSINNINLIINYTDYLEFNFELNLNKNTNNMTIKDLYIKRLEHNFNTVSKSYTELEHEFNQSEKFIEELEKFIDEFMELTIINFNFNSTWNISLVIKINTSIIELYNEINDNFCIQYTDNLCKIPILSNHQIEFNTNFKMINCHTLTINNIKNLSFENLPLSITKLIIKGDTSIINFNQINLPNLETIQLEQSTITTIHSSISHLKSVKTICISNCNDFNEIDLLLKHNYKIESY
jgi:hypothetical protein